MLEQLPTSASLLSRTRIAIRNAWRELVGAARTAMGASIDPDLPDEQIERVRAQIDACLAGRGGEVSARTRAAQLGTLYLDLSDTGRARFLWLLADKYQLNPTAALEAMEAVRAAESEADFDTAVQRLRRALLPPRIELLRQFSWLRDGIKFLIDLRADTHRFTKQNPALARLDAELRELLASWFDVGFLELRRITWESPAALLEKLMEYEAVHEIRSWTDLKNRLARDRRCYAFFHPRMPAEPLIFVEVALVNGMASSIQALLDESAPKANPEAVDTAIFYSISNTQKGLGGISFGNFLIKRVVDDLSHELPNLRTFATLSPIPGFLAWIRSELREGKPLLTPAESNELAAIAGAADGEQALLAILSDPKWPEDAVRAEAVRPVLLRLCARYLLLERQGDQALDRVAHFHLRNGARVERLNWLADRSAQGLAQSAGIMVNYRYKLADIEANHEAYVGEGRIAAAPAVRGLL